MGFFGVLSGLRSGASHFADGFQRRKNRAQLVNRSLNPINGPANKKMKYTYAEPG